MCLVFYRLFPFPFPLLKEFRLLSFLRILRHLKISGLEGRVDGMERALTPGAFDYTVSIVYPALVGVFYLPRSSGFGGWGFFLFFFFTMHDREGWGISDG